MGNCARKTQEERRKQRSTEGTVFVDRELHDTRRMGLTFSIAKSNDKMGVDSEISAKMNHDIIETFGKKINETTANNEDNENNNEETPNPKCNP